MTSPDRPTGRNYTHVVRSSALFFVIYFLAKFLASHQQSHQKLFNRKDDRSAI